MTRWAVGTGRRIIGEVAGHEIHLEIEGARNLKKVLFDAHGNLNFENWATYHPDMWLEY